MAERCRSTTERLAFLLVAAQATSVATKQCMWSRHAQGSQVAVHRVSAAVRLRRRQKVLTRTHCIRRSVLSVPHTRAISVNRAPTSPKIRRSQPVHKPQCEPQTPPARVAIAHLVRCAMLASTTSCPLRAARAAQLMPRPLRQTCTPSPPRHPPQHELHRRPSPSVARALCLRVPARRSRHRPDPACWALCHLFPPWPCRCRWPCRTTACRWEAA